VSLSSPFIRRPVGTTLLTVAIALAGGLAYFFLPVAPLPQVEFPTISVQAALPGASPETMASAVATPLERQFGRIAGVNEMTSTSYLGTTSITMQFDLNRNIDAAARDVQAAINAARGYLPTNLPNNPTYRKVNPADAPVLIIALTSDTYDRGKMYDVASSILQQKLSQIQGIGQVNVGGAALPAVRVEVNPAKLNNRQMSLEDVRMALGAANANRPKGWVHDDTRTQALNTTDQLMQASQYQPLVIAYRNGAPVRLSDVATVEDSVEDTRTAGLYDDKKSVSLIVFRQPGANIIDTVDRVRALMPQFQAEIPAGIKMAIAMDRTTTIRASVHDVEVALGVSTLLVILVVFLFLRSVRTTFIPSIAVPVSLVGTFGVMYLFGYSIDNLSLMALAIATGFVVDDAIVVIENISRHLEQGMKPMAAALLGAREIGFTVLSMSVSLVAVFIPILLMGGIVGRLLREFAVTLSAAIVVSLLVSLTATPMMCAKLLKSKEEEHHGRLFQTSEKAFNWLLREYEVSLSWVMRHQPLMLIVTLATIGFTIFLYSVMPKGFFPQQDTGRLMGQIQADQDTSFDSMDRLLTQYAIALSSDPAVDNVVAFTGGQSQINVARMFVALKPLEERQLSADEVMVRLRRDAARIPGAMLQLQAVQDLRIGGRMSSAQYQYTLQSESLADLNEYAPQMLQRMRKIPGLADVNTDQQNSGLEATLTYDRTTASRLGISTQLIDDILYGAFGQRQVSTMYRPLNQYHVVMEVDPKFARTPDALEHIYVPSSNRGQVPLSAFARYAPSTSPLAVNHSGQFPSATISFNTLPGVSLSDAVASVEEVERELQLPDTIHGSFSGTAQAYQDSLSSELILVITALLAVYIVLGILYESYIHPITILSTLPSAGVGALLALLICHIDLSIIALIGILLLIGIVKKNAIMMIDFALDAERKQGTSPDQAIVQACILRFRPIIMTTMAALLGAFPLAIGMGIGAELRRPLGIAIIGGLIFSQILTLYTTPVVYVYLDRLRLWLRPPGEIPMARPAPLPA
jgi:hydrophobe/amphiphile efflux-1 (HAE1) family protein